jgi:hypothetical protein
MNGRDEIVALVDGREEDRAEAGKGDGYGGDRACLDDGEEGPAIEEAEQR